MSRVFTTIVNEMQITIACMKTSSTSASNIIRIFFTVYNGYHVSCARSCLPARAERAENAWSRA